MPPCPATMTSSSSPQATPIITAGSSANCNISNNNNNTQQKYHALIIDSGAIIKQTSLSSGFSSSSSSQSSILTAARHYYTVPSVLTEIRDSKSRSHLTNFTNMLSTLHNTELITRTPSHNSIEKMTTFSKKTGDYNQLSNVDLQVLALLYDLEVEAANIYNNGNVNHVREEPKRVLGVHVKALNGNGIREVKRIDKSSSVSSMISSSNSVGGSVTTSASIMSNTTFFQGNANGIIDASNVDLEYDDENEDDNEGNYECQASTTSTSTTNKKKKSTWATLVNPSKASSGPIIDYSIGKSSTNSTNNTKKNVVVDPDEEESLELNLQAKQDVSTKTIEEGQFDDASSSSSQDNEDDNFSLNSKDDDGEIDAINIANATSDDVEYSDEECDVYILDPHEAVYLKKLKEQKKLMEAAAAEVTEEKSSNDDAGGLELEFPSLDVSAAVPYEGCSDDEEPIEFEPPQQRSSADDVDAAWKREEKERKQKSLQPMVNGRIIKNFEEKQAYNSFRKYGNVVSEKGAAVAMKKKKHQQEFEQKEENGEEQVTKNTADSVEEVTSTAAASSHNAYRSRILGAANAALASSSNADGQGTSEMTTDDDDGEGWVTCTRDIQTMKATGSLHLDNSRNYSNNNQMHQKKKKKNVGPPIKQRAACATTDFAMQNVILQMNLELLSVDGVRIRRLKTWVTRCGACFTIYGNDCGNKSSGSSSSGRLFCDKCGSNTLQRIAASVDRDTGRLKLHMKKNYQYNTRGTKFSLPKAGTGNKYEGDLLLAEDQLLYGAWNQKVRKGKSKTSGQSIFGSDLASDLGCITDLTRRDDIRVGFGRRNPNSTKFGRERRGKKKKGAGEKACGLRRY